MKTRRAMIAAVVLLLTACVAVPVPAPVPVPGVVIDPADPYVFSPPYCVGCWYGQ
jgi:starvation-inducible outer membrane lipoprotein